MRLLPGKNYIDASAMIKLCENSSTQIYMIQFEVKEFVLIIVSAPLESAKHQLNYMDMLVNIKNILFDEYGIKATFGVSKSSSNSFFDVHELYRQSQEALKTRLYSDTDLIILFEEIENPNNVFEYSVNLQELFSEVKEIVVDGRHELIEAFIDKYLSEKTFGYSEVYIKSFTFSVINLLKIQLIESNESFDNIFGDENIIWNKLNRFETIKDIRKWLYNIIESVIHHLYRDNKSENQKVVEEIKNIIKSNYNQQLTVNDIAKSIFLSLSQANNIFKKSEGKTIFDYLVDYRIKIAMQLLKQPESRIYSVAEKVGYFNKSHFCLLFKKCTGLSPQEYKNKFTNI